MLLFSRRNRHLLEKWTTFNYPVLSETIGKSYQILFTSLWFMMNSIKWHNCNIQAESTLNTSCTQWHIIFKAKKGTTYLYQQSYIFIFFFLRLLQYIDKAAAAATDAFLHEKLENMSLYANCFFLCNCQWVNKVISLLSLTSQVRES